MRIYFYILVGKLEGNLGHPQMGKMPEPKKIIKKAKTKTAAEKRIYAARTRVSELKSREEIKHILEKFGAVGFQYTELPNGFKMIRFTLPDPELGYVPVQIEIPQLIIQVESKEWELPRQAWRLVVEVLKVKLYSLSDDERRPIRHFLDYILTEKNITLGELSMKTKDLYLPFIEKDE